MLSTSREKAVKFMQAHVCLKGFVSHGNGRFEKELNLSVRGDKTEREIMFKLVVKTKIDGGDTGAAVDSFFTYGAQS